jgi:hypothetical protein
MVRRMLLRIMSTQGVLGVAGSTAWCLCAPSQGVRVHSMRSGQRQ